MHNSPLAQCFLANETDSSTAKPSQLLRIHLSLFQTAHLQQLAYHRQRWKLWKPSAFRLCRHVFPDVPKLLLVFLFPDADISSKGAACSETPIRGACLLCV